MILLEYLYCKSMSVARVVGEQTYSDHNIIGIRQDCGLSPVLFNLLLEAMMSCAMNSVEAGVTPNEQILSNLHFADDI